MLYCNFCNKNCKNINSLKQHEIRCRNNPNRIIQNGMLGKKGKNQYIKAKELGISPPVLSEETKKRLSEFASNRKHSEDTKNKLSKIAIKNELGGHTSKKRIWYKCKTGEIVNLHSSYEVIIAKELDNFNIEWIRPKPLIWVDADNISHRYYADFYLPKFNIYLDPKNDYLILKDKNKIERVEAQNNVKIVVLQETQLSWEYIASIV